MDDFKSRAARFASARAGADQVCTSPETAVRYVRAEYDDRCWHELPFDELAAEAQAIADRTGDKELADRVKALRAAPGNKADAAEMVIAQIENFH